MNASENQGVMEIDLGKLFRFYLDHWKAIICSAVATTLIAFLVTFFLVTPLYKADITVYVNNMNSSQSMDAITGSNLSAAQQLVRTYVNIIQSNTVLNQIIETGDLSYTPEELRNAMVATQVNDTEMFTVSILNPDPEMAAHIADTVAAVAPDMIADFIEGSSAKIIDYAVVPEKPDSPSYPKNLIIGTLLGFILSGLFFLLRYMFDMRLKTEDDIAQYFTAPVLGSIPDFNQNPAEKKSWMKSASRGFKKGGSNR